MALAGRTSAAISGPLARLIIRSGRLVCGELTMRCAVGRAGIRRNKTEGDGATPAGSFPLRRLLFRADRIGTVATGLPARPLAPDDGWCDDPTDARYNTLIKLPTAARHEELWREDHLYDVIVVIGYNDAPAIPGKGSAIFLHVTTPDLAPTAGCVAIGLPDLLEIARRSGRATVLEILEADSEKI